MKLVKPPRLKRGDVVGVIAPSAPVANRKDLERGEQVLESIGLRAIRGENALKFHWGHEAGTPEERLHDFHVMFQSDGVDGIFCTGGGLSSKQLLLGIDWDLVRRHPKVFVGYSDITALLNALFVKTGLVTFHGPTVELLEEYTKGRGGRFTLRSLERAVMSNARGRLPRYTKWKVLRPGKVEGRLVGGNLYTLSSLIGTPYEPRWHRKILFFEDEAVTIEEISDYFSQLELAGVFKKIRGMIVGKITKVYPINWVEDSRKRFVKKPTVAKLILEATERYNFPILAGVDFGHEVPSLTLPVGAKARLICPEGEGGQGTVSIVENYLM